METLLSPNDEYKIYRQVVVTRKNREEVLEIGHALVMNHLGIREAGECISRYSYWPGILGDVSKCCRKCELCQVTGKPWEKSQPAPLQPIPVVNE